MFQNYCNKNNKLKKFGFAIFFLLFCRNHNKHDAPHVLVVESLALTPPFVSSLVSRQDFFVVSSSSVMTTLLQANNLLFLQKSSKNTDDDENENENDESEASSSSIILPLRYLPVGGCWALKIMIVSSNEEGNRDVTYYGVLDTGSPFLTAPSSSSSSSVALINSVTKPTLYPTTKEQYGESVGTIIWRKAPYITLLGSNSTILDSKNVILGVVGQESGGIFVGMIPTDDNRPSFLQQLGMGGGGGGRKLKYKSFVVNFAKNYLQLSKNRIIDENDPDSLKLVSLQPYGPDLYHFAIDCFQFVLKFDDDGTEDKLISVESDLNRPVLCVLDTGLTGCIFSDSLQNELLLNLNNNISFDNYNKNNNNSRRRGDGDGDDGNNYTTTTTTTKNATKIIKGLTVSLRTQQQQQQDQDQDNQQQQRTTTSTPVLHLPSSDQYWIYSSFKLPWFYDDEEHHPHIIALGCTFWANVETLAIDTKTNRAKIKLRQ